MLTQLLACFPRYTIVERPTPVLIAPYRALVPPAVIAVWERYGFGIKAAARRHRSVERACRRAAAFEI